MKTIFISILLLLTMEGKAQITLDTIVHPWNLFGYDFYPVQISETETKYYSQDTLTNTFNLYNMDFSPFLLNISVPEPFAPFSNLYDVLYLSRTLFDCDSANIEYAYAAQNGGPEQTFYIMRTDGTLLFRLDSAIAPYCFGCLNGSLETRPIMNTSSGAKLYLYSPKNSNNLHIYSLCGVLSDFYTSINSIEKGQLFIKLMPNPTSGDISFMIDLPDNINEYELVVYSNDLKKVHQEKITFSNQKITINTNLLSNGIYHYSVNSSNKHIGSGHFIIDK